MRTILLFGLLALVVAACSPTSSPTSVPSLTAGAALTPTLKPTIMLTSPAFANDQPVPVEYTCQGKNQSPALQWQNIPAAALSLTLIVEDPDAPSGSFTHWVLANLPPASTGLAAGQETPPGAISGNNGGGKPGYTGPCPPAGKLHHYIFTLYAADQLLKLDAAPSKASVLAALQGHILASGQLVGTFQR
jgi:Raf kinase inhibitor-like YbhB/YbcL family protein